jgi:hypothetical protein
VHSKVADLGNRAGTTGIPSPDSAGTRPAPRRVVFDDDSDGQALMDKRGTGEPQRRSGLEESTSAGTLCR